MPDLPTRETFQFHIHSSVQVILNPQFVSVSILVGKIFSNRSQDMLAENIAADVISGRP